MNLNQVTLPSTDIVRSVVFYQSLGFRLIVDSAHYARFECPQGEATFSVHLVDSVSTNSGVVVYFENKDLDTWVAEVKARGVSFEQEPADMSWLWREARLKDPDGNQLCLFYAGENRRNPPWRVKGTSEYP